MLIFPLEHDFIQLFYRLDAAHAFFIDAKLVVIKIIIFCFNEIHDVVVNPWFREDIRV